MPKPQSLSDMAFDLKFTAKQFERESKRAMNEMEKEKKKAGNELAHGQIEVAKIYAENAMRQKAMGINMIKLSSRLQAVASQMEMAEKTKEVSKVISTQVPNIEKALKLMNNNEVAQAMMKFEGVCENLQVQGAVLEGSLGNATGTTNQTEVEALLNQLKDQQNINVGMQMGGTVPSSAHAVVQPASKVDAGLEKALQDLK